MLTRFTAAARLDVEREIVPTYYDAFRLRVTSAYPEMFARDLTKVLVSKNWRVVRTRIKIPTRQEAETLSSS